MWTERQSNNPSTRSLNRRRISGPTFIFATELYAEVIEELRRYLQRVCVVIILPESVDWRTSSEPRYYSREWLEVIKVWKILTARFTQTSILRMVREPEELCLPCLFVMLRTNEFVKQHFRHSYVRLQRTWLIFMTSGVKETFFSEVPLQYHNELIIVEGKEDKLMFWELYKIFLFQNPPKAFLLGTKYHRNKALLSRMSFHKRRNNLWGSNLEVFTYNNPPFTIVSEDPKGIIVVSGYIVEVWKLLENVMNFSSTYVDMKSPLHLKDHNKGFARGLMVDYSTFLTDDVLDGFHLTTPLISATSRVYIRWTRIIESEGKFLSPFSKGLWLVVLINIVIMSIILYGFSCYLSSRGESQSFLDSLFIIFTVFCSQGETVRCQNISCKILYLVACIGAYILLTAYSGILVSFLAVSDYSLSSTSVDKMFEENRSQAVGVVRQSAEHMILKASNLDVIVKLRKGAIVDRTDFAPPGWHTRFLAIPNLVMYDSVNEAIYALWAKKEAVVLTDNHLMYDPDPWYTVVQGYSYRVHFSVGFRDGLHHTVNYNIYRFREFGLLQRTMTYHKERTTTGDNEEGVVPNVRLYNLRMLFFVLLAAMIASLCILGLEIIFCRHYFHPLMRVIRQGNVLKNLFK